MLAYNQQAKGLLGKLPQTRAQWQEKGEQAFTFARLALSGKPMITVQAHDDGSVSLTEGYFGSKSSISGLRFEDLPQAVAHRLISEDAALEAFRFMLKSRMFVPSAEE